MFLQSSTRSTAQHFGQMEQIFQLVFGPSTVRLCCSLLLPFHCVSRLQLVLNAYGTCMHTLAEIAEVLK